MKMKPVLSAIIVILAVASLAAVGTYAGFSDIETSRDNYLETAELNLRLRNPESTGEQWDESVLRTWHYEENLPSGSNPDEPPWYGRMQPGDSINSNVNLEADGTFDGNHIDIYCSNVNEELDLDTEIENERENELLGYPDPAILRDPNQGIYDKDTKMIITYMKYHTTTIIRSEYDFDYFTDTSGDDRISLDEFEKQPLLGLTPVPTDGTITFTMDVKFAEDAGDEYQGDRTNMTLMFALMQ
ncbi:unnamed protein product [marine sediment metagenome]|uniref:EF-hand domain-containing protein n=1 Tax=marine sediment metagenome TaxID=412755 RepID=X1UAD4_9ZZZZ